MHQLAAIFVKHERRANIKIEDLYNLFKKGR